ncbi:putative monothiol glutaredoxin-6 precursor [Echria macrotheca]|uniref:Monothiol glutaredoxin-6 n=1 Tax=Echria macrotheca TaxID=438768 RepID=A0AAJ0BH71_9PEZI|nr:putative monothiol glutaredoxin-6 precursor [Echria macrotheca]
MPSPRRIRLLLYVALGALITMLFVSSHFRETKERDTRTIQDFYHKTMNAMDRGGGEKGGGGRQKVVGTHNQGLDDDDEIVAQAMAERLRLAEQKAKDNANAKAPNKPDDPEDIIGVGSSASGQKKKGETKKKVEETDEDHEVEAELTAILKKSPIIIFSKSYCPHSKKAKGILLDKYDIYPAPYVVELDQHHLGRKIQDKLVERTGRSTVPNIMVFGVSIGGGDEMAELDRTKTLAEKLKELGGRRIQVAPRAVNKHA